MSGKTITREQAASIAHVIATFRTEWNLRVTTDEIEALSGSLSAIAEHAIRVASDWGNKAPTQIGRVPMGRAAPDERPDRPGDSRRCDICNRGEWACGQAQRNTGLDPHPYRAWDDANVYAVANGWQSGDEQPRELPI